jgi:hypothetical protein
MQREIRARASEVAGGKDGGGKGMGVERRGVRIYRQRNKHRKGLCRNSCEHRHACTHTHMDEHMEMRIELGGWS